MMLNWRLNTLEGAFSVIVKSSLRFVANSNLTSPYSDAGLDSIQNCKKVRLSIIIFTISPARGLVQGPALRLGGGAGLAHITLLAHGLPGRGPGHQRRHITISIAIPMGGQGRLPPTHHPAPPCPNKWGWR